MYQTHIGQIYSDGIIFHQFINEQGLEEVMIVSLIDLSNESIWIESLSQLIGSNSKYNGLTNTNLIVQEFPNLNSSAKICKEFLDGSWYLPSILEIDLIKQNIWNINKTLLSIGNTNEISLDEFYWTSTEDSSDYAFYYSFVIGNIGLSADKKSKFKVRAIKKLTLI